MEKKFERSLLLSSDRHSLYDSLTGILGEVSGEVRSYDVNNLIKPIDSLIQSQILKAPFRMRTYWENYFQRKVNQHLTSFLQSYNPDLVLVYNSEFLLPETCNEIKKKAKLIFYLADSPFYTPQNNFYLTALSYADLILSPDTFWSKQLNTIGLDNVLYFIPGPDNKTFYRLPDDSDLSDVPAADVLYVGASYFNSWGYKKALFMSHFTEFDFHLYGNSMWKRWFRFFPGLESAFTESGFIKAERLNRMFNRSKLMPVDGNPGILNGIHLRTFEALSTGSLPLIEFRDDVEGRLFNGYEGKVPVIRDYSKASDIARYYLNNETERKETAISLRSFIEKTYSKEANSMLLCEALEKKR